MKLNSYSIYDTASGLYSRPFFTPSDAEAIRSFSDIVQDAEHPIGRHPEDYTLFRLGRFDDTTGAIDNEVNESLCTALERLAATRKTEVGKDLLSQYKNIDGKLAGPGIPIKDNSQ